MLSRIFIILFIAMMAVNVNAQQSSGADASKRSSYERREDDPLNENVLEMNYKWRLREEEKEYQETVERTDQIARLSEELNESFAQNEKLVTEDAAKLNALEKLLKKVRKNLGGNDDEELEFSRPSALKDALKRLGETSKLLNAELKESTRYEISADSIENINTMLKLIESVRIMSGT